MAYIDHIKSLKMPTSHYRQVRGDMIEMYKILSGNYDTCVTARGTREHSYTMTGNDLKLQKNSTKYYLRKFFFINRVVNIWNSLPKDVVLCDTGNKFKPYLDKYWQYQDIV